MAGARHGLWELTRHGMAEERHGNGRGAAWHVWISLNSLNYKGSTATRGIQDSETLHAQTSWGDRLKQTKEFLPRNYTSEICPCNATYRQIGSDWGYKSSKPNEVFWKYVVFLTTLEQMFKRTATDLITQPPTTQQRLACALNNATLLLPKLATCKSRLYCNPKGRSHLVWGPVTWEAKPLARHVQSSGRFNWRWDVATEEDLIALSLRQQQPSDKKLAYLTAHVTLWCVFIGVGGRDFEHLL
jgi:hypothetical protein